MENEVQGNRNSSTFTNTIGEPVRRRNAHQAFGLTGPNFEVGGGAKLRQTTNRLTGNRSTVESGSNGNHCYNAD